jgi:hypothetical protein
VRAWLRRMSGRLDAVRRVFVAVAIEVLPGMSPPIGDGSPWRDARAALGCAMVALRVRFGAGRVGQVTAARVAVALSGGRLLAPGWPDDAGGGVATRVVPATFGFCRSLSRGPLPDNRCRVVEDGIEVHAR